MFGAIGKTIVHLEFLAPNSRATSENFHPRVLKESIVKSGYGELLSNTKYRANIAHSTILSLARSLRLVFTRSGQSRHRSYAYLIYTSPIASSPI